MIRSRLAAVHSNRKTWIANRRLCRTVLLSGTVIFSGAVAGFAIAQDGTAPPKDSKNSAEIVLPKLLDGEEDFEEACRLRLNVDSVDTIKEIIELAKSAIKKGLDEVDTTMAKKIIASSYFQKAEEGIRAMAGTKPSKSRVNKVFRDTLGDLTQAIENDPLLADAYVMKTEIHAQLNEREEALEVTNEGIGELGTIVDEKKSAPELKIKLSKLLMMRAGLRTDVDELYSDLKRSIQYDPNNQASVGLLLGKLVQAERSDEALEFFRSVLESSPENELIIRCTAELLAQDSEKLEEALSLLDSKIKVLPNSVQLLKTRGKVHLAKKNAELAKLDMDRVLELSKGDVEGLMLRAKIAMEADDIESARKDVDDAIELAPDLVELILMRSAIASEQKRFGDAIIDLQKIVKNQPSEAGKNVGLLMQLGLLYSLDNRPSQAIKIFGQVVKADPDYWQAYRMRGDTFLAVKEYANAIEDFEKALKLVPLDNEERSAILNNLSWTLSTSLNDSIRNGKRSLELGLEACELTKYERPHILSTLAAAYAEQGDFDKAVEWSEKAVKLGREKDEPQLDQLEAELESYRKKTPWREKTETKENRAPLGPKDTGVDT